MYVCMTCLLPHLPSKKHLIRLTFINFSETSILINNFTRIDKPDTLKDFACFAFYGFREWEKLHSLDQKLGASSRAKPNLLERGKENISSL